MFTILDYSSALEYSIIRHYTNIVYYYYYYYNDGNAVEQCAVSSNLSIIHDAKLQKSFNSARWMKGYNPDLIFATLTLCEKYVPDLIPIHNTNRSV